MRERWSRKRGGNEREVKKIHLCFQAKMAMFYLNACLNSVERYFVWI
jgi:hypothetical protein